ncbi:MAG: hypothetical protein ABJA69_04820 [Acidobacteriaceae bacterium]
MTDQDITQLRREKWRLTGNPVRTLEDARAFIHSVGFCMMYPMRETILLPTFIGAFTGSDSHLPLWKDSFADPRAQEATGLMVRMLRERDAFEANLMDVNNGLLVAASIFPYFYALVGERNPKQAPKAGARSEYSQLACDAFEFVSREGPVSKQRMRDGLGGSVSFAALDHALGELWSRLRITRVDYQPAEGSSWDVLYRWSPDSVREGMNLSVGEALSALISKYLDSMIAAEQQEIETFFGNFVPRSRVQDAIKALLAARELSYIRVGSRTLIQITPAKAEPAPRVPRPGESLRHRRTPARRN